MTASPFDSLSGDLPSDMLDHSRFGQDDDQHSELSFSLSLPDSFEEVERLHRE